MVNRKNTFGSLCEDVLVNILYKLPERDVLKCKCVSKEWLRIVSHVFVPLLSDVAPFSGVYFRVARSYEVPYAITFCSQEVKDQLHHLVAYGDSDHSIASASLKPHLIPLFTHSSVKKACAVEMTLRRLLPFEHRGPDFVDCCNGLVLFVQRPKPRFFVCNPAIKQYVPLPLPPSSAHLSSLYASLAFNPSESIEYRVVISTLANQPQCLHVFCSQTGEWKTREVQIEFPTSAKSFKLVRHSVYLKNMVYRLSMFSKILCFDINSMKARVINCPCQKSPPTYPKDGKDEPPLGCIGVSNGLVSYVTDEDGYVCVWLLGEPNESSYWTLKYKISCDYLWKCAEEQEFRGRIGWLRYCGFHPTSEILFLGSAFSVYMYHIESGLLELVRYLGCVDMYCSFFFPLFLHKNVFVTLKNWCKGITFKIDNYEDIQDHWCYIEQ